MPPSNPAQLTLLHAGALGDLVLALQFARRHFPAETESGIHALSRVTLPALQESQPPVRCTSAETAQLHWLYADATQPPPKQLPPHITDRPVLNFLDSTINANLERLAPASVWTIDPRPQPDATTHITHQWAAQLISQSPAPANTAVPSTKPRHAASTANHQVERDVLIHLGSGHPAKCWPRPSYATIAAALRSAGLTVQPAIGPVEQERWTPTDHAHAAAVGHPVTASDAATLIDQITASRLVIGNDSGPTHLAAWLGVPTLTLFGPTRASTWRPLGPSVYTLQGDPARGADWGIDPALVSRLAVTILTSAAAA